MVSRAHLYLTIVAIAWLFTGCHKQLLIAAPQAPALIGRSKYTIDEYKADVKTYEANVATNAALAKATRDKIVYGFMGEIDDAYGQYTKSLFTGKGLFGVIGDTETLGLTAASTIATHAPTKTLLSALATGITGVNLSFDKNFFAQQSYQAIATGMQTRRDKARDAIAHHLEDEVADYPLAAARRDLVSYFYAGTLPGGLQELQEEAGAAAKQQAAPLH